MSDLFILYCGFMYLFTIGLVIGRIFDKEPIDGGEGVKLIFNLILAPILTPIAMGWCYYEKS